MVAGELLSLERVSGSEATLSDIEETIAELEASIGFASGAAA